MITVGFGDIVPISNVERVYCIFMTVIASGVFAYTVNTVGTIFQEMASQQAALKKEKYEMLNYMRSRNIDKTL